MFHKVLQIWVQKCKRKDSGRRGVQESWSIFKHHVFQAQDQCITMSKKSSKGGRRPLWMSRDLLANLKQILGRGKRNWPCGRTKGTVRICGDLTKKAKAHLELSLARDMKYNKKSSYKYIRSKRKMWGCCWIRYMSWWQKTQRRPRYWMPQFLVLRLGIPHLGGKRGRLEKGRLPLGHRGLG